MGSKTVPLSVRISHSDAEFLARLKIADATTPSDKLRALIAQQKAQATEGEEYHSIYSFLENRVLPINRDIRELQNRERVFSELVRLLIEWVPEAMAFILSNANEVKTAADLASFESEAADRVFRLLENFLRLGVTEKSPCIDENAIPDRMLTCIELVRIIESRIQTKGE